MLCQVLYPSFTTALPKRLIFPILQMEKLSLRRVRYTVESECKLRSDSKVQAAFYSTR